MAEANPGDRVKVHYTGRLADDTVFDSSEDGKPLEFTIGAGEIIPGFEQAVTGMSPGEEKTATLDANQAYGERREDLLLTLERDRLPEGMEPQVGERLQLRARGGDPFDVVVSEVGDENLTVDANHPLAGKELTFDIRLVEIVGE